MFCIYTCHFSCLCGFLFSECKFFMCICHFVILVELEHIPVCLCVFRLVDSVTDDFRCSFVHCDRILISLSDIRGSLS